VVESMDVGDGSCGATDHFFAALHQQTATQSHISALARGNNRPRKGSRGWLLAYA